MNSPSQNRQITSPTRGDIVSQQMQHRLANGEFNLANGEVNWSAYNEAMKQLIDKPSKTKFNTVCSLWAKEGIFHLNNPTKKVLFECNAVQKEVVIPAGVKVLVLKATEKTNPKSPDASVVYLTEEIL